MPPHYPLLLDLGGRLTVSALLGKQRSFGDDARFCVGKLRPEMQILGAEHIPSAGPGVITINHYHRPGFQAWWLALGVSAVVPADVHWIITSAWRYSDWLKRATITPASYWAFRKVAEVYNFSTMPPMPPTPQETLARAAAVRRVLAFAKYEQRPLIGLAPVGQDPIKNHQDNPPPGVGRFLLHLSRLGLPIIPVAAFENQDRFSLAFGSAYQLEISLDGPPPEVDRLTSQFVMARIRELLPKETYNEFSFQEMP